VSWVLAVLIIPRAAATVAGQFVSVPTVAEIEGMRDGYATNRMNSFNEEIMKNWRNGLTTTMPPVSRRIRRTTGSNVSRIQYQDSARKVVQQEFDQYGARLEEGLRQKKNEQMRLGALPGCISPAPTISLPP